MLKKLTLTAVILAIKTTFDYNVVIITEVSVVLVEYLSNLSLFSLNTPRCFRLLWLIFSLIVVVFSGIDVCFDLIDGLLHRINDQLG